MARRRNRCLCLSATSRHAYRYPPCMDTWDAIRARRNVRAFTDEPLTPDELERILEAGRRAPSSSNEQRWDFVVVTGREELQELAKVWQYGKHVATSAATVALV